MTIALLIGRYLCENSQLRSEVYMFGHWFVIASQKSVSIYTETKKRNRLELLRKFENPIPEEASTIPFSKEICNYLESEHQSKNFYTLTIAAEPHFSGKIRAVMSPVLQKLVLNWIRKDLEKIPIERLPLHLPLDLPAPKIPDNPRRF